MKKQKYNTVCIVAASLVFFFAACSKSIDNYKAPDASIYGALLDSKANDTVYAANNKGQSGYLFLYQQNYSSSNPNSITSDYTYNGTYENGFIFSGSYKVVPTGAFYYMDTVIAKVNGKTLVNLKVSQWIYVTIQIGAVTSNSITVTYTATSNDAAQQIARVATMLSPSPYVDINNYGSSGRMLHSVSGADTYTFTDTFTGLSSGTVYYLRAGSRMANSTINPNNYYNYSRVIQVKTP